MKSPLGTRETAQAIRWCARGRDRLRPPARLWVRIIEDRHLEEDPVEPSARVVAELSARRRLGVLIDPAEFERLRVDDAPVARDLQHHDRMLAADFIEIKPGQHASFAHLGIIVATAAQPTPRRRMGELGSQLLLDLGQRRDGIDRQIEMQHIFGGNREMRVRVVESRNDHRISEIDDLIGGKPCAQLRNGPGRYDTFTQNRERLRFVRRHRDDPSSAYDHAPRVARARGKPLGHAAQRGAGVPCLGKQTNGRADDSRNTELLDREEPPTFQQSRKKGSGSLRSRQSRAARDGGGAHRRTGDVNG
jgi:hypothetical protein